jgi:hypothetical protein
MYKDKIQYFNEHILPVLEEAFKRGDAKYQGKQHSDHPRILTRTAVGDIRHVRELHCDVRLREAEEAADCEDLKLATDKIVSAIGYLIILHARLWVKPIGDGWSAAKGK